MNQTKSYDFTIIVPVFNEEDNITRLAEELGRYLPTSLHRACVLFVDDGSRDDSLPRLKAVCAANKDFFYLSLKHNGGLTQALKAGIDATYSRYVGYIDADLQTAPDDFNLLLPHLDEHALVIGIRADRKDKWGKRLQSKIANGFRRAMTHDNAIDTGCPLKVMRTENAKRLPLFTGMHRFLPALFLLQGVTYEQIPVRHFPRVAGVSKYHLWNRLVAPFFDCFVYRWMKKRYVNYEVKEQGIGNS